MILCPKCAGHLSSQDQEPFCLICGYADYTHQPSKRKPDEEKIQRLRESLFKFPYIGLMKTLKDRNVYFSLKWIPTCPFCNKSMTQQGGNTFRCKLRHRIRLATKDGTWAGWW